MSEIEDPHDAPKQDGIQEETTKTTEANDTTASLTKESDNPEIAEKLSTVETKEEREEIKGKIETEVEQKETTSHEEKQSEEIAASAELATVTKTASPMMHNGSMSSPLSGIVTNEAKQAETAGATTGMSTIADSGGDGHRVSGHGTAVGEWNSLPILVERLREALELSLAKGRRHGIESTSTATMTPLTEFCAEGDRSRVCQSMEQAIYGGCIDPASKKDELKFLEDLLLSDIQTALSHLRETLERTDIASLMKHGGVSDPTSKLHLLRLVSSLLSRLQVPKKPDEEKRTTITAKDTSLCRKRRGVRHTIGVSAEEIAHARKRLEENNANLARFNEISNQQREQPPYKLSNESSDEKHVEEIRDKYTKDVINQRQSLRDRNKEPYVDSCACRSVPLQKNYAADKSIALGNGDLNIQHTHRQCNVDNHQQTENDNEAVIRRTNDEHSQVTKLAAIIRQRAELINARCNSNNNNNKYTIKKSKIKRANTIDIPSYLKLQNENLENTNCMFLRRPINVGDKITSSTSTNVVVPSFHPITENDKKFLALINKNNDTQTCNTVSPFKSFNYTKVTDMSSVSNENWNNRFSNIKTAFDKPSICHDNENKVSPKLPTVKRFPGALQIIPQVTHEKSPATTYNGYPFTNTNVSRLDAGFRHAPSSPFQKIEKPTTSIFDHWQKSNVPRPPGNTLREKARSMFDRDNNTQHLSKFKKAINENSERSSFPRPPWITNDKNDEKPRNTVTEHGRLDYRIFCKQFAPFQGKNAPLESKKSQNTEISRRLSEGSQYRCPMSPNEKIGVVDGKISFRVFPEKRSQQIQQYHSNEPRREIQKSIREKFEFNSEKDTFEPNIMKNNYRHNDTNFKESIFGRNLSVDSSFNGNSSLTSQTANNENHSKETHVLQVTPKISKNLPFVYNNASIPLYNEKEQPTSPTNYVKPKEQWTLNSIYHPIEDPRHFISDIKQNTTNVATKIETLPIINSNAYNPIKEHPVCVSNSNVLSQVIPNYPLSEQGIFQTNSTYENYCDSKAPIDSRLQIHPNQTSLIQSNQNSFEIPNISHEIDKIDISRVENNEQNIENQDISTDAGIVTRYTCAIGTVASGDIQSDKATSNAKIPPLSLAREHAEPTVKEITTYDDEIRRHNMLQQTLVRRLQNEHTTLNDRHSPISNQSNNFNQISSTFQTPESKKRPKPPRRLKSPRMLEMRKIQESKSAMGILSAPSSGSSSMNRITTLKEQYEQPNGQTKLIQKERSPILNGAGTMDSSDEYLISCANKPSRSIVLSKSESWHQLAVASSHKLSENKLSPVPFTGASCLPKPPKPKSPSAFKMKKQYEASSSADSVKKMENKIRRYFDNAEMDHKGRRFSSRENANAKDLISLSRSRTMPGICEQKLSLLIPVSQISTGNLNSAEVDKVFDDIFEEATKTDDHCF